MPVEWFALSSGAKISMDSGTENMDWVSRALRRIITFTQDGGEINVVVAGINVGAQPYWNAEATMLMHTKGILVMTPDSAMVLTGKQSLDYSGGVSAEDNFGIGGYDRVMGPNGQAQYWAPNLPAAVRHPVRRTTTTPTSRRASGSRAAPTPPTRSTATSASFPHVHPSSEFTTVGDIFSASTNPDRKKPFDIRTVMRAVVDQDHAVLERWADMADADTSVVFDAHLGGYPGERHRHRVAGHPAQGLVPRRRARPVDGGHAVPAVVEEDRPGDQRRQRQPAAGGAGQPVRLRRLARSRCATSSWSTAPRSAGPSSTSTARSCSAWSPATTAAPSWCSPARSTTTWRCSPSRARSPRSSAAPPPRRSCSPERSTDGRGRPGRTRTRGAARASTDAAARPAAGRTGRHPHGSAVGQARRGGSRVRSRPQHRTGPRGGLGPLHHPGGRTAPSIVTAVERGMARTVDALACPRWALKAGERFSRPTMVDEICRLRPVGARI